MERIPSRRIKSGDAEIVYWILGEGSPVVLLHPFPVHHEFWLPVADVLATRYRVVLPDLRGHGESELGDGPATMEKHAADIACVLDDANIGRAPLVGVSIGGYTLFEFWRKHRGRVAALGLCNTKAPADGPEARAGRLQAANEVLERGTEPFFESMIPKVMAKATRAADDAKNVRGRCGAGAAWHGGASGLCRNIEDHRCTHAARHRRRRRDDRRQRSRVDAAAYQREPAMRRPEGRALLSVGAARSRHAHSAPVSRQPLNGLLKDLFRLLKVSIGR